MVTFENREEFHDKKVSSKHVKVESNFVLKLLPHLVDTVPRRRNSELLLLLLRWLVRLEELEFRHDIGRLNLNVVDFRVRPNNIVS